MRELQQTEDGYVQLMREEVHDSELSVERMGKTAQFKIEKNSLFVERWCN